MARHAPTPGTRLRPARAYARHAPTPKATPDPLDVPVATGLAGSRVSPLVGAAPSRASQAWRDYYAQSHAPRCRGEVAGVARVRACHAQHARTGRFVGTSSRPWPRIPVPGMTAPRESAPIGETASIARNWPLPREAA